MVMIMVDDPDDENDDDPVETEETTRGPCKSS